MRLRPEELESLLEKARAGDQPARSRLLEGFRAAIKAYAASRLDRGLVRRADASDIAQETLAAANRELSAYLLARPLPFWPWLGQFTRDIVIDFKRKHITASRRSLRREVAPGSSPAVFGSNTAPSEAAIRRERIERVRKALGELAEDDREILSRRHLNGLSLVETARACGLSIEAAKSRQRRALVRLRAILERLGENGEGSS